MSTTDDMTVGTERLPNNCAAYGSFNAQEASTMLA
jgi:hypothetical protein